MKSQRLPRFVLVTRKTLYEQLLEQRGTPDQARFYLRSRGRKIEPEREAHERFCDALRVVESAIPPDRRRTRVDRDLLSRFLFAPDDVVIVVGQDGLVANAAKYLEGQLTLGVNPDPERYDGVLCRHAPSATEQILHWHRHWSQDPVAAESGSNAYRVERRTMAEAKREDGQTLRALNEIFVGHQTHQSARYLIRHQEQEERHSSSGLICTTGTGATGWARSISEQRGLERLLPTPTDPNLVFFVREPFPSVWTQTEVQHGTVDPESALRLESEMGEGGVLFADGIESDWVEFVAGQSVEIRPSSQALHLVVPDASSDLSSV